MKSFHLEQPVDPTEKRQNKAKVVAVIIGGVLLVCGVAVAASRNPGSKTVSDGQTSVSHNGTIPVDNSPTTGTDETDTQPTCSTYQAIDSQTWLEIVKDPDSYSGQCYTVYGEVTQFDSATGTGGFRADVGGVQQTPSYGFVDYPTNTALVGDPTTLASVVEQDLFTANVMVLGSYSYDTQIGGQTTVPQLQVDSITVTGSLSS